MNKQVNYYYHVSGISQADDRTISKRGILPNTIDFTEHEVYMTQTNMITSAVSTLTTTNLLFSIQKTNLQQRTEFLTLSICIVCFKRYQAQIHTQINGCKQGERLRGQE